MRERPSSASDRRRQRGITPAYAGKTHSDNNNELVFEDHPRVCGKDKTFLQHTINQQGSPPRMRERLGWDFFHVDMLRITPAYAGKTLRAPLVRRGFGDHPRVCGKDGLQ